MWDQIVGQERVKRLLRAAIKSGRIAHAYLFYGAEGAGMDAMAIEFARALNCEKQETDACGTCPSCKKFDTLQHPNLKLVFALPRGKSEQEDRPPVEFLDEDDIKRIREQIKAKSKDPYHRIDIPRANEIRINSIRELRRDAALRPFARGRKVFIIFDGDEMNAEASNALLKTLEEPAPQTILILTTSKREKLRSTILSRCQPVRFDPLSREAIRDALIGQRRASKEEAELVATIADGNFTRALELLGEDFGELRKSVVAFVRNALKKNSLNLLEQIDELTETFERADIERWLSVMLVWFRDTAALHEGKTEGLVNVDQLDDLEKFALNFPQTDFSSVVRHIDRAIALVGRNVYLALVLLNLAFQLRDAIVVGPKEAFVESKSS